MQRMANLLTTRSNVYAVWITAGFFEVNPSGILTGNELGTDTGQIKRHREGFDEARGAQGLSAKH